MPLKDAGWRGNELLCALLTKVEGIEAMRKRLSQTRKEIESFIAAILRKLEGMTCVENADRVLTRFMAVALGKNIGVEIQRSPMSR